MTGRPRKIDSNISENKEEIKVTNNQAKEKTQENVDIQKLIQDAIQKALSEQSKTYEEKIKTLENQIKIENENDIVLIPDNSKIEIRANISGKTILVENRGKVNVFLTLNGYKDIARISYEELCALMGKLYHLFKDGTIAITNILSDNRNVTLEKLIEDRNLTDTYFNKNKITPINIEDLFNDTKTSERDFENLVSNTPDLADTILEVAYVLYRKGLFKNNSKMNYLRQIFKKPNLFK